MRCPPASISLAAAVRGEPSDLANLVVDACHDLRTPLAAAFGFARTIERMGGVTGDNAMYLQQVVEATQELEQLIAALSAVAHGERGTLRLRPQPVDLGELALEASEGSGHALERTAVAGMIETDPARAVTSLVWLAAPFAEAPPTGHGRMWRIAAADSVTFGPLGRARRRALRARPARLRGAAGARPARRRGRARRATA